MFLTVKISPEFRSNTYKHTINRYTHSLYKKRQIDNRHKAIKHIQG